VQHGRTLQIEIQIGTEIAIQHGSDLEAVVCRANCPDFDTDFDSDSDLDELDSSA